MEIPVPQGKGRIDGYRDRESGAGNADGERFCRDLQNTGGGEKDRGRPIRRESGLNHV